MAASRRLAVLVIACVLVIAGLVTLTITAASASSSVGGAVLNTAESRTGSWYVFGGAGPNVFDCSGIVVWAAARHGIRLPHSTYAMLAGGPHLYRIPLSEARRGDLLFFGSGHVEFDTVWHHMSFGAHHSGTTVGWRSWGGGYGPTMAMRLR